MDPTILLTETYPNNIISPNISLSEFPLLETTPKTQERTMTHNHAAAVDWDTLVHQKITTNPTIPALTRKYFDACKRTVHLVDSC